MQSSPSPSPIAVLHNNCNPLYLCHDPDHPYIPIEMFLIMPASQDQYYVGEGKSIRRFLFEATATNTFTEFEKDRYKELVAYWERNRDKLAKCILDCPVWDYSWKLRWLTSEQFDIKNTIKAMEAYSTYLLTQRFNPNHEAEQLLKQGLFYVSGRDAYFRPILVFNIDKMIKSNMTQEQLVETQKYFFEKVLNYYLLPGQIETWVAIIDVGYQNLTSLVGPMKQSFGFLANTFRNRMRIAYVVRIPGALSFLWMIIKNFLHEDTAKKINFLDQQQVGPLLEYTNPSQLQTKYGGTQPEITQFWPPRTTKQLQQLNLLDFSHPKVVSTPLSKQAYKTRWEKSKLNGHKISKVIIEHEINKERQEMEQLRERQKERERQRQRERQTEREREKEKGKLGAIGEEYQQNTIENIEWPIQCQPHQAPKLHAHDNIEWCKLLD